MLVKYILITYSSISRSTPLEDNRHSSAYLYNDLIAKAQRCFVIVFALFAGWLLSFPFQGRVFYSLLDGENIDVKQLVFLVLISHFLGLIFAGFLARDVKKAKRVIRWTFIFCLLLTLLCLTPKGPHFFLILPIVGFLSGIGLASFGYFFHIVTPCGNRFRTAADLLIASNILMILLNGSTIILSPKQSLVLAILPLIIAFLLLRRLFESVDNLQNDIANKTKVQKHLRIEKKYRILPIIFLCLFIGLVTIDSGLMYSVINPGFAHLEVLSLWYWAVPYIAALLILRNLPNRIDRTIFLFIAISMIGLSFLAFMLLDKTTYAFFLVNTLMMGAFGIFDLFWWSILGEMLDEWENKARVFGIGLAANVLGIIIGQSLAIVISRPEIVALLVVFVGLVLLPLMNQQLTKQHTHYVFLSKVLPDEKEGKEKSESKIFINELLALLSRREQEILPYLLEGNTNKMIAVKLSLSENTVKTHIKNIYSKLEVRSRNELLHLVLEKDRN